MSHIDRMKLRALAFCRRVGRPVLLGQVSLELGLSLAQTRAIITCLLDDGHIRELSAAEVSKMRDYHQGFVFELTDPKSVPMDERDMVRPAKAVGTV